MAFKDISVVLYKGSIKLDYKDKAHRYYVRERANWDLPESDPKAWGKVKYPKGTTTLLGDTLEKKGLMQWPKGLALRELFGFYDFTNDNGDRMTGFSKGVGTLWHELEKDNLTPFSREELLPICQSANTAWQRKQKKGADIGSIVHDAIEHYIKGEPFDIANQYMWNIKEADYESEEMKDKALEDFQVDVDQAKLAFQQFVTWWEKESPELVGAEELVYSKKYNVSGTFDGLIRINDKLVLCDWKTSNASASKEACMPEGINYQYFIQSAIYAMAWQEMGNEPVDDLLIVSCRKDGGFTTIYASDLGYSIDECIEWAKAVITCYEFRSGVNNKLWEHAFPEEEK